MVVLLRALVEEALRVVDDGTVEVVVKPGDLGDAAEEADDGRLDKLLQGWALAARAQGALRVSSTLCHCCAHLTQAISTCCSRCRLTAGMQAWVLNPGRMRCRSG